DTTQQIVVSEPGVYVAMVTDTAVCPTYDSFYLAAQYPVPLDLGDTLVCEGATIRIDAQRSEYDTYLWSTGANDPAVFIPNGGLFTVTATNGICTVTDTVKVTLSPRPVLSLALDTTVCFRDL